MVDVCLLGCGGMMPLPERWLTSMMIRYNGKMIMVDCGEGNQIQIRRCGWGFKNIDAICLTHYHPDHIAGLPGFLLTLGNSTRSEPLTIIGPPGLYEIMNGIMILAHDIPYELNLIEVKDDEITEIEIDAFTITCLPVDHTDPCLAYSIDVKRYPLFDVELAQANGVPQELWSVLQQGYSIEVEEGGFTPDMVLGKERRGVKVCYTTDTRPTLGLVDLARDADLLICEGMYGEPTMVEKAKLNKHMTFSEAAMIAKTAKVRRLWLTHYSPSMSNPEDYLDATRMIFMNTELGENLKKAIFNYDE